MLILNSKNCWFYAVYFTLNAHDTDKKKGSDFKGDDILVKTKKIFDRTKEQNDEKDFYNNNNINNNNYNNNFSKIQIEDNNLRNRFYSSKGLDKKYNKKSFSATKTKRRIRASSLSKKNFEEGDIDLPSENNHVNRNLGCELCYQVDLSFNDAKSRCLVIILQWMRE